MAFGQPVRGKKSGIRRRIFGKQISVNLFSKRGFRVVSDVISDRARAIGKCAKGQDIEARRNCFATGGETSEGRRIARVPKEYKAPY